MATGITPGERIERETKTARIHGLLDRAEALQELCQGEFGQGVPTVAARDLARGLRKILADRELEDARDRRGRGKESNEVLPIETKCSSRSR